MVSGAQSQIIYCIQALWACTSFEFCIRQLWESGLLFFACKLFVYETTWQSCITVCNRQMDMRTRQINHRGQHVIASDRQLLCCEICRNNSNAFTQVVVMFVCIFVLFLETAEHSQSFFRWIAPSSWYEPHCQLFHQREGQICYLRRILFEFT